MLKLTIEKDRAVVSGVGSTLLKLKHSMSRILPSEDVIYSGRAQLTFPWKYAPFVHGTLIALGCVIPDDIQHKLDNEVARNERHLSSRDRVIEIQEEGLAQTGSEYWDNLLAPHQGIAANCMTVDGLKGLCLFDEQGTGKTLSAIAAFDLMREKGEIDILLIVAQKSMLGTWQEEFKKFSLHPYSITEVGGSAETKFEKLATHSDVYVLNYESVGQMSIPVKSLAIDHKAMLVVDESYFVKNPDARRSAAVRSLRSVCEKAFVLCGTPAPNRPEDIINQFDVADDGYTFIGFKLTGNVDIDRQQILNRIDERGVFLRRTKSEVLVQLPTKKFDILEADMSSKQRLLYEKAKYDLVLYLRNLDNTSFRRNLAAYFQRRAALLQICVSPRMIDKTYDEVPGKYAELDEVVKSVVDKGGRKIVIWSVYTRSIDELTARYQEYGLVRIDGTVGSSSKRTDLVRAFQTDPAIKIFVGNPAAAGAGLTLHAASESVYVSFSNQAAHYMQSLDRIHRMGQMAPDVRYYLIICRDSIEEAELRRLSRKERMQRDLLGDHIAETYTLESALAELGV